MYTKLAHLYDWTGVVDFSIDIADIIQQTAAQHGITMPGPLLDLGCGTGETACLLAKAGWQVIGVDWAEAMLDEARRKVAEAGIGQNIKLNVGDIRNTRLSKPVPMVYCVYDTVNHMLVTPDLEALFASAHRNLLPGGVFLFDVNTEANFLKFWQGKDKDEGPNVQLSFEASYDVERGRAVVAIQAAEHTESQLVMTQELVTEQYWNDETLRATLTGCGFEVTGCTPFNPSTLELEDMHLKTLWVCKKG